MFGGGGNADVLLTPDPDATEAETGFDVDADAVAKDEDRGVNWDLGVQREGRIVPSA